MEVVRKMIQECPIIDNHAHNLLLPNKIGEQSLLSATSEARSDALSDATSTLAHYRAVRQIADILNCQPIWGEVNTRINEARAKPNDAWARQCFQGIATVLIDDGLDKETVHPVVWHSRLTPHPCKRILRIEVLAQDIITAVQKEGSHPEPASVIKERFTQAIDAALGDPFVVGFKSVICYRSGLDVSILNLPKWEDLNEYIASSPTGRFKHLNDRLLNPLFVYQTACCIEKYFASNLSAAKPFQFHTGLGDNDIELRKSSAAQLQPLLEHFKAVKFVLLHASYPFTREAAYLASVYKNCYLDIGEVFPMLSHDGQEHVIREALELCPSEKLCWSTDGHWFPEVSEIVNDCIMLLLTNQTYLLAVIQVREGLETVLCEYVTNGALTVEQAVRCGRDILYNTSNRIYNLRLPALQELSLPSTINMASNHSNDDSTVFQNFLERNPQVKYLHLQFLDFTGIRRGRVIPIKRAETMFASRKYVGIQRGLFRMLQNDSMAPNTVHQGEWSIKPCPESLRGTPQPEMAAIQCEIQNQDGSDLSHDPRTVLRRVLQRAAVDYHLEFQFGFEIEVVFMKVNHTSEGAQFTTAHLCDGHLWSGAAPLESTRAVELLCDVLAALEASGVELEQYHSEGAKSQYEFILAPLGAMAAVEGLIAARAAIASAADKHGLRATLVPKIIGQGFGTGAHVHLSMTPDDHYQNFYAGVLRHMRGIMAFAMSAEPSYERMGDGAWSGGTWVCWGDQNREACLRRIEKSHWECKVVDGLAHPYLVMAAIIGAGLHGVAEAMELTSGSVDTNPGDLSSAQRAKLGIKERLPANFSEALKALQDDKHLCEQVLGPETVKTFADVKKTEAQMLQDMEPEQRQNWLIARY